MAEWESEGKKETYLHKSVQPPWRTAWRSLKKLKLELPHDPAVTLPGTYLEKNRNSSSKTYAYLFAMKTPIS